MEELRLKLPVNLYDALKNANLTLPNVIIQRSKTDLCQSTGLRTKEVEIVLRACSEIVLRNKICTANNLKQWLCIKTGCSSIDSLTRGGIPANGITEIVGCAGAGKTQLCLQISLTAQLPRDLGGLQKSVVYICTDKAFPVKRLMQLCDAFHAKYPNQDFSDNVYVKQIADIVQLKSCWQNLNKLLATVNIGLIVIDSIAGVFRSENLDVDYRNRKNDLVKIISTLRKFSERYQLAIVCVNQVTDNLESGECEPCLGLAWGSLVTTRLFVSRLGIQIRELEVVFSPNLPNAKCKFVITPEGLSNLSN